MKVCYSVNGKKKEFEIKAGEVLLDVLRRNGGTCGACTVLIDGLPYTSCTMLAAKVDGSEITTIKGIGTLQKPHPLQKAFVEKGAVQCGFCTPGIILVAYALLKNNPDPTDDDIKKMLDGNLCRCTGYVQQIEAVKLAAKMLKKGDE